MMKTVVVSVLAQKTWGKKIYRNQKGSFLIGMMVVLLYYSNLIYGATKTFLRTRMIGYNRFKYPLWCFDSFPVHRTETDRIKSLLLLKL